MADEATSVKDDGAGDGPVAAVPQKAKKVKAAAADKGAAAKKTKAKPNHPPTSEMVQNAIKTLKERGGSSLQAIKKFMSATYKIDADKLSPFIKKYIKSAVIGGQLVQTKGKGASGSFRLPTAATKAKEPKKKTATSKPKAVKKTTAKPVAAEDKKSKTMAPTIRKSVASKAEEKPTKVVKKADIKTTTKQKSTKAVKSAAKKPKAPKPKRATGAAKKSKK